MKVGGALDMADIKANTGITNGQTNLGVNCKYLLTDKN